MSQLGEMKCSSRLNTASIYHPLFSSSYSKHFLCRSVPTKRGHGDEAIICPTEPKKPRGSFTSTMSWDSGKCSLSTSTTETTITDVSSSCGFGEKNPKTIDQRPDIATSDAPIHRTSQKSLDDFTLAQKKSDTLVEDRSTGAKIDELAQKIDTMLKLISPSQKSTVLSQRKLVLSDTDSLPGNSATNLIEFVSTVTNYILTNRDGRRVLSCKVCSEYLNAPKNQRSKVLVFNLRMTNMLLMKLEKTLSGTDLKKH